MTMREVCSAVTCIRRRQGGEMKFQAALRGMKLDLGALERGTDRAEEYSAEEEKKAAEAMARLLAKKRAERRGKNG
jgi:hypothetical protein